jgi:uncharacterized OsmC-like protein
MDSKALRALQAPLKEGYKHNPQTALIQARAEGVITGEAVTCHVQTLAGTTVAGLHPAAGGDGSQACSADMLLQALVACAGVTMKSVATVMGIALSQVKVIAEGIWDARGTLGIERAVPVGLTDVALTFELKADS